MNYVELIQEKIDSFPRENKQRILDLLFSGNSVDEIGNKLNLETNFIYKIIIDHVKKSKGHLREVK